MCSLDLWGVTEPYRSMKLSVKLEYQSLGEQEGGELGEEKQGVEWDLACFIDLFVVSFANPTLCSLNTTKLTTHEKR